MKIEKINDNQIRCTLTSQDLESHQVKLTELAYGTDKARRLFQEMMQQAQAQVGFEAENMPLMIEAIPLNKEGIILVITKVEDPEELDTRFSRFAPFRNGASSTALELDGADDILDLFRRIRDAVTAKVQSEAARDEASEDASASDKEKADPAIDLIRLYRFHSLENIIEASKVLADFFDGKNSLYKNSQTEGYDLVLHQSGCSPAEFNRVCNMLSEYGQSDSFDLAGEAYFEEHGELILQNALQELSRL